MKIEPHRLAELRSLAYHEVVAERLRREPEMLDRARARVARWRATGAMDAALADAWVALVDQGVDAVIEAVTVDDDRSVQLRSCTPFAGEIEPRERWALWTRVKAQAEAAP